MRSIDPLEILANAIIVRAVEDYRLLWDRKITDPSKQEIIKFFHSQWFKILTKINPDWLIERLEEEASVKRRKVNK